MLCDKCKRKEAVFHKKMVVNGSCSEEHLCEDCARKEKVNLNLFEKDLFFDDIDNFFDDISMFNHDKVSNIFRMLPFADRFLFDCDTKKSIEDDSLIVDACKCVNDGVKKFNRKGKDLNSLKFLLDEAVRNEDYEKAAKLKKQIDKLKK